MPLWGLVNEIILYVYRDIFSLKVLKLEELLLAQENVHNTLVKEN